MKRTTWYAVAAVMLMIGLMGVATYLGSATDEALRPPVAQGNASLGLAGLLGLAVAFGVVQVTIGNRK